MLRVENSKRMASSRQNLGPTDQGQKLQQARSATASRFKYFKNVVATSASPKPNKTEMQSESVTSARDLFRSSALPSTSVLSSNANFGVRSNATAEQKTIPFKKTLQMQSATASGGRLIYDP